MWKLLLIDFRVPKGTEIGNPLQEYLKNTNTSKYKHTFRKSKPHTAVHFRFKMAKYLEEIAINISRNE